MFKHVLMSEVDKVKKFYESKANQLAAELQSWVAFVDDNEKNEGELDIEAPDLELQSLKFWTRPDMNDVVEDLYVNLALLYSNVFDLLNFIKLNQEGIRKIIKKFDKVTKSTLTKDFTEPVEKLRQVDQAKTRDLAESVKKMFSKVVCHGDEKKGGRLLSSKIRPMLSYERDVVWRDLAVEEHLHHTLHLQNPDEALKKKDVAFYFKKYVVRALQLVGSLLVFLVILCAPSFMNTDE